MEYTSEKSGTKTYHSKSISTNPTVPVPALDANTRYTFKVAVAFDPEFANVGPYSKSIEVDTDGIYMHFYSVHCMVFENLQVICRAFYVVCMQM